MCERYRTLSSFPIEYFDRHSLPRDWQAFLLDFQQHWPTHEPNIHIDFIRHGSFGQGAKRMGENTWLRLTERWTATAKSVFLFDVQGSVAYAAAAWLQRADRNGSLGSYFNPPLMPEERAVVPATSVMRRTSRR
jgi:hypothetical protein